MNSDVLNLYRIYRLRQVYESTLRSAYLVGQEGPGSGLISIYGCLTTRNKIRFI